jgi:hypothetical protein
MLQKYDYLPLSAKVTSLNIQGKRVEINLTNLGELAIMCPDTKKMSKIPWDAVIDIAIREGILIDDVEDKKRK